MADTGSEEVKNTPINSEETKSQESTVDSPSLLAPLSETEKSEITLSEFSNETDKDAPLTNLPDSPHKIKLSSVQVLVATPVEETPAPGKEEPLVQKTEEIPSDGPLWVLKIDPGKIKLNLVGNKDDSAWKTGTTQQIEKKDIADVQKIHIWVFQTWSLTQMSSLKVTATVEAAAAAREKDEKEKEIAGQVKRAPRKEHFKNYQPSFIKKKTTVMEQLNNAKRVVRTNFRFILVALLVTTIWIFSLNYFNPKIHNYHNYKTIVVGAYYKFTRKIINLPATRPIMRALQITQSGVDLDTQTGSELAKVMIPTMASQQLVDTNSLAKARFSLWPVPGSIDIIMTQC